MSTACRGARGGIGADHVKPDDDRVIAHTKMIGGGETTSVTFPVGAIQGEGPYGVPVIPTKPGALGQLLHSVLELGPHDRMLGLLNIGTEPEKGNELAVEAHAMLRDSDLNFVGNIEGRDVIQATCDVLVADGFVGNVLLKFYESIMGFLHSLMREALEEKQIDLDLVEVFRSFDYTEYGGAPLLGVNGVSIICHGGSPPRAIRNAIRVAVQAVESDLVGHMQRAMSAYVPGTVASGNRFFCFSYCCFRCSSCTKSSLPLLPLKLSLKFRKKDCTTSATAFS